MDLPNIKEMTDEEIKQELKDNGVVVHHKTGHDKLITTLTDVRTNEHVDITEEELKIPEGVQHRSLDGSTPASRAAKAKAVHEVYVNITPKQKALKLTRVVVVPNDPIMANYPGLIFSVASSRVTDGEMIKKFVPFNNENGWHIPGIILDQIEAAEMQKFKTVVRPDGEKVLEPYLAKKFNVRILPDLTVTELEQLAASQQAAGFNLGA